MTEREALEAIRSDYDAMIDTWRTLARQALDVLQCLRQAFPSTVGILPLDDVVRPLQKALKADKPLCHILEHGHTLCGLAAPPSEWPDGEVWIARHRVEHCGCIEDCPLHGGAKTICTGCKVKR